MTLSIDDRRYALLFTTEFCGDKYIVVDYEPSEELNDLIYVPAYDHVIPYKNIKSLKYVQSEVWLTMRKVTLFGGADLYVMNNDGLLETEDTVYERMTKAISNEYANKSTKTAADYGIGITDKQLDFKPFDNENKTIEVEHPSHYTNGNIETIEIIEEITKGYDDGFVALCVGNAIKYLARSPFKHDDSSIDLKKASKYLEFALNYIEKEKDIS